MALNIKLEAFEGPLDLLLHLIEKAEVDIYDIPIAAIADQYIEYIKILQSNDLELASEFLVMAATLLEIKSRMLLPKPRKEEKEDDGIDPREELIRKLIEYKKFKDITSSLKDKMSVFEKVFYKSPEPIDNYISADEPINNVTIDLLFNSFKSIMLKSESKTKVHYKEIYRELITVEDKIKHINRILISKNSFYFDTLFEDYTNKYEIIVTFLAILELIKRRTVNIEQNKSFDRILLTKIKRA